MALVVNDRVKETSTTTGTGTLTLDGAVTGFETFSSAIGNTNTTYYAIELPNTAQFEVGLGTVSAGQLARTTVISSSNSDALVNFSAGTKNVFCTLPASKAVIKDASDNVIFGDNEKANFGDGNDLQIYHDGSLSYIVDSGTGDLRIESNFLRLVDRDNNATTATFDSSGVNLRHNDAVKLTTTSTGIDVTGRGKFAGTGNTAGIFFDNTTFGTYDWEQYQNSSGQLVFTISGTGGAEMALVNGNTASYTNAELFIGGSEVATTNNTLSLSNKTLISPTITGDVAFDTNTLYVDSSNNRVGIGTTSPSERLHIFGGDILFQGATPILKFQPTADTQQNKIDFAIAAGTVQSSITGGGVDGQSLKFDTASSTRMTINSSGNVGIGTSSPQQKFHVEGSSDILQFLNSTDAISESVIADSGGSIKYGTKDSGEFAISVGGSANSYFANGSSEALRIDSSGNVGIGTSSPSTLLHLSSSDPQITITDTDGTGSQVIKAVGNNLELVSANQTVINSASTIFLDSNNGLVAYNVGATEYMRVSKSTNSAVIKSSISDGDLILKGNDGGTEINALHFDMSDSGFAEFNSKIRVEADTSANAILVKGRSADDIGTIKFTANDGSGNQGELSARSSVFIFNTPTQTNFRINNTDKLILTSSQVNLKDTVFVDANEQIQFGDAGENISGDGTDLTIASSRHIKFDATNDITLDAGAGGLKFDDDGVTIGLLFNASGDLTFKVVQQDKDLNIKGNDGGSEITALSLDMSEAGAATFNDKVILGANKVIEFGDAGENISGDGTDLTIASSSNINLDAAGGITLDAGTSGIKLDDDGTTIGLLYFLSGNLNIKPSQSDTDLVIKGNDGGSEITALTLDMSEAGAATFNSSVTVGANLDVSSGTIKLDGDYPTGSNNVALGDTALDSVTSGGQNTAIGSIALTALTTASFNTAIGYKALEDNISGTKNTAIGSNAASNTTGANNVAIGVRTLFFNTLGGKNTAVGEEALLNGTSASQNTALGYQAGTTVSGGSNLTILGYQAEPSSGTATNEITLGNSSVTSLRIPGLASGASSGDVLTYDGTDITLSAPTGVSAGFSIAMAIAL